MDIAIGSLYFAVCAILLVRMLMRQTMPSIHLGLLALFSVGYMIVPLLMKAEASLTSFAPETIAVALSIHFLYFLSLLLGFACVAAARNIRPVSAPRLDELIDSHRGLVFFVCLVVYVTYFFSNDVTSYSSDDFEKFFHERSPYVALIATVAGYSQALMAVTFALSVRRSSRLMRVAMAAGFAGVVVLLLSAGQRLAVLAPCIMLFVAFANFGQKRQAFKILGGSLVVLLLLSPFAVYLREAGTLATGKAKILEAASDFSYGDSTAGTALKSIAERADLLSNTIYLKAYIDHHDYVGPEYYYSVLISPVPRLLLGEKPYPVSSDGTIDGEISNLAWRIIVGWSTGSLTAFGAITAYRQGGWLVLIIDGLLVGALGAYLCRRLAGGGAVGGMFYVIILPIIAVKRVPASLMEALADILPMLPAFLVVLALDRILQRRARRRSRWQGAPGRDGMSVPARAMPIAPASAAAREPTRRPGQ
ncbi:MULTISPECIES: hypothetical protein [Cupriavidus]